MEDILKYKWALIGTVVLHILLAFSFSQLKFEGRFEPLELTEVPVLLEEPEIDPQKQEELDKARLTESGKISNQTFNEADKMAQTNEAYDSRKFTNVDEKVETEVKDLEKQFFDEMKNNRESKYGTYDPNKNQKTSDKKNQDKTEESTNTTNSNANRTMSVSRVAASYDLKGRRDEIFAKPSYICKGTGTIVVKIKVNRSGRVIAADIDMSVSTYTEECMIENAKKYAQRCKFEAGTSYPEPQSGTITYTYIAQ